MSETVQMSRNSRCWWSHLTFLHFQTRKTKDQILHSPNSKHCIDLIELISFETQLFFHPTHICILKIRTIKIIHEIHQTAEGQDEEIYCSISVRFFHFQDGERLNLTYRSSWQAFLLLDAHKDEICILWFASRPSSRFRPLKCSRICNEKDFNFEDMNQYLSHRTTAIHSSTPTRPSENKCQYQSPR